MFPIPADRALSIWEIGKYWSDDIRPQVSPRELRELMVQAWWRDELLAANAPMRIDLLRALYKIGSNERVAFALRGVDPLPTVTHLEDGSVEVDMRVDVTLPNESLDSWTAENCKEALTTIADNWDEARFDVLAPGLIGIRFTRDQFFAWLDRHEFDKPTFWGPRPGATREEAKGPRRTGTAGRPTSMSWILPEAERRLASGEFPGTLKEFAEEIRAWASTTPQAREEGWPVPQCNSLENKLRELWNKRQKPPPARSPS
jgi:hypothetical protein